MIPRTFKKYIRGEWWEVDIGILKKDDIVIAEDIPNDYRQVVSSEVFTNTNSDGEKVKAIMTNTIQLKKGMTPYVWRE